MSFEKTSDRKLDSEMVFDLYKNKFCSIIYDNNFHLNTRWFTNLYVSLRALSSWQLAKSFSYSRDNDTDVHLN